MVRRLVVVGGGAAAVAALVTLRAEGFDGPLTLVGEEDRLPYERPPLSKRYLTQRGGAPSPGFYDSSWYATQGIEVVLERRVTELDLVARSVALHDGGSLRWDALLLATGARLRRLGPVGSRADGGRIHYLRDLTDAARLKARLHSGGHILIIGGGFIGCEVAAAARTLGAEVTLIEQLPAPLERALGREVGDEFAALHREHGVQLLLGQSVASLEEGRESVVVRTGRGEVVEADAALVGIGVEPRVELAARAGLRVQRGVCVDDTCATSHPGVWAAGDVAEHVTHPLFGGDVLVEHFDNALKQGAAAARSMLGASVVYDDAHWFWSDQYGHNLQTAGMPLLGDSSVMRGSVEKRSFVIFSLRSGVVIGAIGLDAAGDVRRAVRLVAARAHPAPEHLADVGKDLRDLLPSSGRR